MAEASPSSRAQVKKVQPRPASGSWLSWLYFSQGQDGATSPRRTQANRPCVCCVLGEADAADGLGSAVVFLPGRRLDLAGVEQISTSTCVSSVVLLLCTVVLFGSSLLHLYCNSRTTAHTCMHTHDAYVNTIMPCHTFPIGNVYGEPHFFGRMQGSQLREGVVFR
jgi:hypothetical protein